MKRWPSGQPIATRFSKTFRHARDHSFPRHTWGWMEGWRGRAGTARWSAVPERDRGVAASAISRFPTIDTSRAIGPPDIHADWGDKQPRPFHVIELWGGRVIKVGSLFRGSMKSKFSFFSFSFFGRSSSFTVETFFFLPSKWRWGGFFGNWTRKRIRRRLDLVSC